VALECFIPWEKFHKIKVRLFLPLQKGAGKKGGLRGLKEWQGLEGKSPRFAPGKLSNQGRNLPIRNH